MFSYWPLHTDEQVLDDKLEPNYNTSVRTQDVVYKICQKRLMIVTNVGRDSGKSGLATRHDDDGDEW